MEFRTENVPIKDIVIGKRRKHSSDHVKSLATSIKDVGLLHPVGIDEDYKLVFGLGRIEAHRELGLASIACRIGAWSALQAELAEIQENLCRAGLPAAEEAKALSRAKAIYEELHPETKQHVAGGKAKAAKSASDNLSLAETAPSGSEHVAEEFPTFTESAAAITGQSERTIERKVAIGRGLDSVAIQGLKGTPTADNKTELAQLAKATPEDQRKAAKMLSNGQAKNVKEALASINPELNKPTKQNPPAGKPLKNGEVVWSAKDFKEAYDYLGHALPKLGMLNRKYPVTGKIKYYEATEIAVKQAMQAVENWKEHTKP